jgi:hypothetical protein
MEIEIALAYKISVKEYMAKLGVVGFLRESWFTLSIDYISKVLM